MRRFALLFSIFSVAFVVGLLVAPPSAQAACYVTCDQNFSNTATLTGNGCDCATAQADLEAKLDAEVSSACSQVEDQVGVCEKNLIYTTECVCDGPCQYRSVGYMEYRCKWCFDL